VYVDENFVDAVLSAQFEPDLQHCRALHRQKAFRDGVGQRPKTGSVSCREEEGLQMRSRID
jgi:hypothetical protein